MSTKKIQIIGNIATKDDIASVQSDISALEVAVDGKANQATTLDGYGITDAYSRTDGENLAERVENHADAIAILNGSDEGSVSQQINNAIGAANLGQYALKSTVASLETELGDKASQSMVDDLSDNVAYINSEDNETITDVLPVGGVSITDDGNGNVTITSTNTLPEWTGGNY